MIGLAYQLRLDSWLERGRLDPSCFEVSAEPFFKATAHRLHWLASKRPVILHCDSLSLGGPDPIDEHLLVSCARLVRAAQARWVTHPLGFSRASEIDLGVTVPIPFTASTLRFVADRVRHVMDRCGCPLALANSASPLRIPGTIADTDFFNELCQRSGAALALDLMALDTDSSRHGFDGTAWLNAIDADAVAQVRLGIASSTSADDWHSFQRQLAYAGRLRHTAPRAAIVLEASPLCSLETLDRAWSAVRALDAGGSATPSVGAP